MAGTITWSFSGQDFYNVPGQPQYDTFQDSGTAKVSLIKNASGQWLDDGTSRITASVTAKVTGNQCPYQASASVDETFGAFAAGSGSTTTYFGFPYPPFSGSQIVFGDQPDAAVPDSFSGVCQPPAGLSVFPFPGLGPDRPGDGGFIGTVKGSWLDPLPTVDLSRNDSYTGPFNDGPAGSVRTEHLTVTGVLGPNNNEPPVVSAGDAITGHSREAIALHGQVSDDGLPNPPAQTTSQWSVVSAPAGGNVQFDDASNPTTNATFTRPGHYVLQLTGSDSQLHSSATTTADIKDTYTIRTRSWIPFTSVVDPNEPAPLSYRASQLLSALDPNCWTPPSSLVSHSQVYSTFHGDGHAAFDGEFRMQDVVSFDWDGTSMSNFQTAPNTPHVGTTVRNKVYTDARDNSVLASCSQSAVAGDTTTASSSATSFTISYSGKNPLTPQALTPGFVNNVTGKVKPDGTISMNFAVTQFPSSGLQVLLNNTPIVTGRENDVSCLAPTDVLGPAGALTLARGLTSTSNGSATAVPGTDQTFGLRSPLCP
jgi:hypothetical protein